MNAMAIAVASVKGILVLSQNMGYFDIR